MAAGVISIQIRSDLTYEAERGPASDAELEKIANAVARRMEDVLSQKLRAHPNLITAHVQHGQVDMVLHTGLLSFDLLEQFESANQLLTEQRQTIEKALKLTWEKHHGSDLRSAQVSLNPSQTSPPQPAAAPSSFEAFQQDAAMHAASRRNAYIIGGIGGAVIGAFLMWGYLQYAFLRDEVAMLREDVRAARPSEPEPVIVVYPPEQRTAPPPVQSPRIERRSQYYRSRDAGD